MNNIYLEKNKELINQHNNSIFFAKSSCTTKETSAGITF
jgi:hypothetical protein